MKPRVKNEMMAGLGVVWYNPRSYKLIVHQISEKEGISQSGSIIYNKDIMPQSVDVPAVLTVTILKVVTRFEVVPLWHLLNDLMPRVGHYSGSKVLRTCCWWRCWACGSTRIVQACTVLNHSLLNGVCCWWLPHQNAAKYATYKGKNATCGVDGRNEGDWVVWCQVNVMVYQAQPNKCAGTWNDQVKITLSLPCNCNEDTSYN